MVPDTPRGLQRGSSSGKIKDRWAFVTKGKHQGKVTKASTQGKLWAKHLMAQEEEYTTRTAISSMQSLVWKAYTGFEHIKETRPGRHIQNNKKTT